MLIREIADYVGIRERAAHRTVSDLVEAGYLIKERQGTRNRYVVRLDVPMRHPLVREHLIGELLAVLVDRPVAAEIDDSASGSIGFPSADGGNGRGDKGEAGRPAGEH